ncbi:MULTISPECIES: molybdopterin dinucleotide binding domain-containing protein [Bacillus]|uniref:molybdopterin dinucleotide binding domain-containing protein n=1 Tax=Bacillus TaxID=1386 RepID=UPI00351DA11D
MLRLKSSKSQTHHTLFVPIHWSDTQNVNDLIGEALDPDCKMPGFKMCAVRISPI